MMAHIQSRFYALLEGSRAGSAHRQQEQAMACGKLHVYAHSIGGLSVCMAVVQMAHVGGVASGYAAQSHLAPQRIIRPHPHCSGFRAIWLQLLMASAC